MVDIATIEAKIGAKYQALLGRLNEAALRVWAAAEARSLGRGGVSIVAKATGLSRTTIHAGLSELKESALSPVEPDGSARVRTVGGGRKKLINKDIRLLSDLDALVEPTTLEGLMSPLRWTCKSTYWLMDELNRRGHIVSQRTVWDLLDLQGFNLQSMRKTNEDGQHEDRDAQFNHIAYTVTDFQAAGDPVISIDTKKKELIGDFKNAGKEWQPKGVPEKIRVDDFIDLELGKVAPYGVYDLSTNTGWVSVGIDHDTAGFAVESIRRWWREMGGIAYPRAHRLLITADCGDSNGNQVPLWRRELQLLADELCLTMHVCHLPSGTSKWSKIEHCMFCHITTNWRGRPLTSRQVVVNLIGSTTTKTGLRIKASLDENAYVSGAKVADEEMDALAIERDPFHGEWNYRLMPREK